MELVVLVVVVVLVLVVVMLVEDLVVMLVVVDLVVVVVVVELVVLTSHQGQQADCGHLGLRKEGNRSLSFQLKSGIKIHFLLFYSPVLYLYEIDIKQEADVLIKLLYL